MTSHTFGMKAGVKNLMKPVLRVKTLQGGVKGQKDLIVGVTSFMDNTWLLQHLSSPVNIFSFFCRVLTPYEAKSLVALLHSKDCETLERVLVTVSNSAAFTANQVSQFLHHFMSSFCASRFVLNLLAYGKELTV